VKARLTVFGQTVTGSFWFLPALITLGAAALAVGAVNLDERVNIGALRGLGWVYTGSADGARSMLAAIAAAALGVAGTVFSITIAVLVLASGQMGPRLLERFMRDRGNQVTLGVFLATFAYALLPRSPLPPLPADPQRLTRTATVNPRSCPSQLLPGPARLASAMTGPLKDTSPLGKSVEEIEREGGNTSHSSVPAEERRDEQDVGVVPLIPVATTAGVGGTGGAAVGAALITEDDLDDDREREVGVYPEDTSRSDQS
jgi:hypothetical protein